MIKKINTRCRARTTMRAKNSQERSQKRRQNNTTDYRRQKAHVTI